MVRSTAQHFLTDSGFAALIKRRLPFILAVLLYVLFFFLRSQQGGWDLKWDVFSGYRNTLDAQVMKILPSPQAELLSGILLGQNKNLPGQFKLALRDTSTLHIVVASGQNLSMVAGLFLNMAGLIKRKNAILLSLLAVILYTLLSGMQVPILRAAIMFSLTSLATLSGRLREGWWVLLVTAALMLLVNPAWITDLSFQLSFLATFGVIVVAPILLRFVNYIPLVGQDLAVTTGAQLMVMPVIIQSFHQLSVVSVITNLLVGWTVPFIMILGTLMLIAGFVFTGLAGILSISVSVLLTYFIYIIQFFASFSFAWKYIGEQLWIVWVGYYLIVGGVLMVINKMTIDGRG